MATDPLRHICADTDCPYIGQPSPKGCGCHQTIEQMARARIAELEAALRTDTRAEVERLRGALKMILDSASPKCGRTTMDCADACYWIAEVARQALGDHRSQHNDPSR